MGPNSKCAAITHTRYSRRGNPTEADKKMRRAEALRRSAAEMTSDKSLPPDWAHPMIWAPFSLVGEGGALAN